MGSKRIGVLIPDASSVHTLAVARCLAAVDNLDVWFLVDKNPCPGWKTRHKKGFVRMGRGAWIDEVLQAAERTGATVLLPISEEGISAVAMHKEAFAGKINCASVSNVMTLERAGDKTELVTFAMQNGIPIPKSWVFDPLAPTKPPVSEMRFPVLAKPARGTAGIGIQRFDSALALEQFIALPTHTMRYVIQEYLAGYDIGCSVICQGGKILSHTVQFDISTIKFNQFRQNGQLEFKHDPAVFGVVEKTMRSLRFDGVAHCDLFFDKSDNSPKLLEINPRFWGSLFASYKAGINFPELAIRMALKMEIPSGDFQTGRYYSTATMIKNALKSPRLVGELPKLLRNSDLWFRIRDPLPELSAILSRI